jgi:hypothetical protein
MGGNDVLNRALTLAGHGFLVFPCRSDKSPATLHGFKDASKYAERVRELWRKYPGTLVGIACGSSSDLAVLDLGADWRSFPLNRMLTVGPGGLKVFH